MSDINIKISNKKAGSDQTVPSKDERE